MADKISSKDARDLVKYAEERGFTWSGKFTGSGHIIMLHPNGGRITLANTPGGGANKGKMLRRSIDREAERGKQ